MKRKLINEKSQTTERLIRRIFNRIFLLLTVVNILAIVSYNVIQISQAESAGIMSGMVSQETKNVDNMTFQTISNFEEQTDFIRIVEADGKEVMSAGTAQFLTADSFRLGKLMISKNGVFDYVYLKESGITYELWLSINSILQNAAIMIGVIVGIMLLTYLVGLWLIRHYSRKLSAPIEKLATDVENGAAELDVPENPSEIHELAINFNALIARLNQKIKQEEQFVSDASHELRTPVTAIRGHVSLLKRRWHEHPEIVDDSLDYLDIQADRLRCLTEELLTLSRNEQKEAKKEEVILQELIEEVVKRLSSTLPQKIELEGQRLATVVSDRFALQEILTILLENAGNYSAAETVISVKFDAQEIQISDQGIGIPDEEKSRIFDRFYRVDKSRGGTTGTGLGLAIAEQYAYKNQLKLFVTDNLPQGAIFHIKFFRDEFK